MTDAELKRRERESRREEKLRLSGGQRKRQKGPEGGS